jgi:hypothetical protein
VEETEKEMNFQTEIKHIDKAKRQFERVSSLEDVVIIPQIPQSQPF